jgi:hypothetical protein
MVSPEPRNSVGMVSPELHEIGMVSPELLRDGVPGTPRNSWCPWNSWSCLVLITLEGIAAECKRASNRFFSERLNRCQWR